MSSINDFSKDSQDPQDPNANGGIPVTPTSGNPNFLGSATPPANNNQQNDPYAKARSILIDYNQCVKDGKFDQALFRDREIQRIVEILCQRKKPNAILLGEAGVGKTNIVEEIARMIVNQSNDIPNALKDKNIYELPLSSLVAGNSLVGQVEKTVKNVVDFICDPKNKAILFIDEIHLMFSNNPVYENIAQDLKRLLSRGDMHVLAATTTQEFRKIKSDPAFARRFSQVQIVPLTEHQTEVVIDNALPEYENYYHVNVPRNIVGQLVKIADEYNPNVHRPDNALTLLDTAMANFSIFVEKSNLDPKQIASISLARIKAVATSLVDLPEHIDIPNAEKNVRGQLLGQNDALDTVLDELKRNNLKLNFNNKPLSFLFCGPTGTGKTELAKLIAKNYFSENPQAYKDHFIYLNMTEYANEMSLSHLIGASEGFVGYDNNQPLPLDKLMYAPYSVIILDEFEKADQQVQNFFMQALDEGELQTQHGTINFSKAVVIATTNAGQISSHSVGFTERKVTKEDIISTLTETIKPEIVNRFNDVVYFHELDKTAYGQIIQLKLSQKLPIAIGKYPNLGLTLPLDDENNFADLNKLVEQSYSPQLNGRPADKVAEKYIEDLVISKQQNYAVRQIF